MAESFYSIIVSKNNPNIESLDYKWINKDFTLIDESHIKIDNEIIEFIYLFYTENVNCDYQTNEIMIENNIPVTNIFGQTTLENIFYLKEESLKEDIIEIFNEL